MPRFAAGAGLGYLSWSASCAHHLRIVSREFTRSPFDLFFSARDTLMIMIYENTENLLTAGLKLFCNVSPGKTLAHVPNVFSKTRLYVPNLVLSLIYNSFDNDFRIQFANDAEEAYMAISDRTHVNTVIIGRIMNRFSLVACLRGVTSSNPVKSTALYIPNESMSANCEGH
ncbi:hypothetical protein EVAR_65095_1 [Eumeta japonica]|uniref:Uncharacterized protein n=1 Tax=Eumeta variegata TaxID=151549 RepID=A0A4C1Z5I6_EUMVA|nr:hypothetical protein EVAR_65095_1 [Eumeta japonica]